MCLTHMLGDRRLGKGCPLGWPFVFSLFFNFYNLLFQLYPVLFLRADLGN